MWKCAVLKFSTGTGLQSPSKTHAHAQADTKNSFIQTNNCFPHTERKAAIFLRETGLWRVFVLSVMDIYPCHHKQWPPDQQLLLNLSVFSVFNSPSLFELWSNILLSNPGPEIIYWQLLHSIQHCPQLGLGAGLCVIAAIRFWIWRGSCSEIDLCLRRGGGQRRQPAVCVI